MKKILNLLSLIFVTQICLAQKGTFVTEDNFLQSNYLYNFQPDIDFKIPLVKPDKTVESLDKNQILITFEGKNADLLKNFPRVESTVVISKSDKDGSISFATNALSAKNSAYSVAVSYMQYELFISKDGKYSAKIGYGIRLAASITTKKAGINIGDLFRIGIAATKEQVSGNIKIELIGITSKDVNAAMPTVSEVSLTSIQNCVQALGVIKASAFNDNTVIAPKILEVKNNTKTLETRNDIIQKASFK